MKLYHGSSRKIVGAKLKPRQATGVSKKADRQVGVYATHEKDRAIAMALIHLKGVAGGTRLSFAKNKTTGIIFEGWPTQKLFYLYTLPSKDFEKIDSWQWVSKKEVTPLKVEKLKTADYIHMIRKGTKREFEHFEKLLKKFEEKNDRT